MPYQFCPRCASPLQTCSPDKPYPTCSNPACGFVHWNNPVPVVAALVQHEGSYLLARNSQWPRGLFSLISGFIEADEHPEQALGREVYEELGLQVESASFIGHYVFTEHNQLLIAYIAQATGLLTLNHEIAEIKHLSLEDLNVYDFGPLYITTSVIKDVLKSLA